MKSWRSNLVIIFIVLFAFGIVSTLFAIQILNNKYWSALAQGQQSKFEDFSGERGAIFLAGNDFPVATNRDSFFVYVSPPEINDATATAAALNKILSIDEKIILQKLNTKNSQFVVLKENLNEDEVKNLQEKSLKGIFLKQTRERFYPQQTLAANVLGFVDGEGMGQYGVEDHYNETLSGESGVRKSERGPYGFLSSLGGAGSADGSAITLTIDYNIQFMAEKLIKETCANLKADGGQIIVADPKSGAILAMAQNPSFDPNSYSDYAQAGNMDIFQNVATQKVFEPGSVMKPITMAIGLEENKITPQTEYVDEGFVKFGGSTVYNYDGRKYGRQTMTGVIEKSINTGAVFVEELIPHHVFLDYLKKFGFFEETGIDLPETYSENNELNAGHDISFATASFGQGIGITPIQLIRAFSAIANGGKLAKPYVAVAQDGGGDQIISPETASKVIAMMVSVVENGFGKAAKIPGYYIAGKTGTAQVPEGGGYSKEKTIQSFIGFAPAFDADFMILVKLDNPAAKTAEYSAVPVFRDLAKYIINLKQIEPDYQK
jgi:cell division protein FtsI/penicillin-binding protein 2